MPEIAAVIALVSLYVSLRVAWDTRFKPPVVVAFFPAITSWKFHREGDQANEALLVPNISLTNIGARPAIIEDIRLEFTVAGGQPFWATPDLSVPENAVEQPGEFLTESTNADGFSRMVLGKSFCGLVLKAGDVTSLNYHFSGSAAGRPALRGLVTVSLQVWLRGSR